MQFASVTAGVLVIGFVPPTDQHRLGWAESEIVPTPLDSGVYLNDCDGALAVEHIQLPIQKGGRKGKEGRVGLHASRRAEGER